MPGADLTPTPAFLLNVTFSIDAASQASDCNTMRFGLLQSEDFSSANHDQYFVTGLQAQRLTGFARNHDLIPG